MAKKKKGGASKTTSAARGAKVSQKNFAYCQKCESEKQVKHTLVLRLKARWLWVCTSCSTALPRNARVETR